MSKPPVYDDLDKDDRIKALKAELKRAADNKIGSIKIGPLEIQLRKAKKQEKFNKGFKGKYKLKFDE